MKGRELESQWGMSAQRARVPASGNLTQTSDVLLTYRIVRQDIRGLRCGDHCQRLASVERRCVAANGWRGTNMRPATPSDIPATWPSPPRTTHSTCRDPPQTNDIDKSLQTQAVPWVRGLPTRSKWIDEAGREGLFKCSMLTCPGLRRR